MRSGIAISCDSTGFVPRHAMACTSVADQTDCIILFREPGRMARGLIEEDYAMKGFRIDTKSCDWGPMAGFVCADPRLTKDPKYHDKNVHWTKEALRGEIKKEWFGNVSDHAWKADVMPIVLSEQRIGWLSANNLIQPTSEMNDLVGVSRAPKGDTVFPWRLVPVGNATNHWTKGATGAKYFVLCVNTRVPNPFRPSYPSGAVPIRFRGHETILGITNPGGASRGFKACVTADYDLLSIWPRAEDDRMASRFGLMNSIAQRANGGASGGAPRMMPGGIPALNSVDTRLQLKEGGTTIRHEHHRFGDVSARVMHVKVLLNSAIMSKGNYGGGNAIHHNDEVGNMALAKGSLAECLPVIAFFPPKRNPEEPYIIADNTALAETVGDFKEIYTIARARGFAPRVKEGWV